MLSAEHNNSFAAAVDASGWKQKNGVIFLGTGRIRHMEMPVVKDNTKRLLFWTPRLLCILFAVFISLFALDVFGEGHGFWGTMVAFLMHLIPTGLLLIVLAMTWRWELVGGILFPALGVFYLITAWGRFNWAAYVFISGPLFLVGVLFLVNWLYRDRLSTTGE